MTIAYMVTLPDGVAEELEKLTTRVKQARENEAKKLMAELPHAHIKAAQNGDATRLNEINYRLTRLRRNVTTTAVIRAVVGMRLGTLGHEEVDRYLDSDAVVRGRPNRGVAR